MITVAEAKDLIKKNSSVLECIQVDLYAATGMVLAEDIYSSIDSPPFNQSAMDGYAYRFSEGNNQLMVVGEIAAGDSSHTYSKNNSAVRIFTGAQVPEYFDTVVMQEKVERIGNSITIKDVDQKKGMNIRLKGSQITKGSLALISGTFINPGVSGYLASLGVNLVKVIRRPRVTIISTGNELVAPGAKLESGKIFESNTYSLYSALSNMNIQILNIHKVIDNELETRNAIEKSLIECDVLILSGGVSVGDYDFVARSLEACKVNCLFHKVKQKPGKPLYFGKRENVLVFGLPGNPAALLTCFYEYVKPALQILMSQTVAEKIKLKLKEPYSKKPGLTHFLKGEMIGNEVKILGSQESYLMNSFVSANCLVQLDEERTDFSQGELLDVLPLT